MMISMLRKEEAQLLLEYLYPQTTHHRFEVFDIEEKPVLHQHQVYQ